MELGLMLDNIELFKGIKLSSYNYCWGSSDNGIETAMTRIAERVGYDATFTHLYYGNEFCEYRLPNETQLLKALQIANDNNLKFVFVTPPVTDWGISQIKESLKILIAYKEKIEIVVNDHGVLQMLSDFTDRFEITIGRICDKLSHDSRASLRDIENYYSKNGLNYARTPGVVSQFSLNIYKAYNVNRFEFDMPKVGISLPENINASLYWPFQYLTMGRVCLFRASQYSSKEKFLIGKEPCTQLCKTLQIEKRKPLNGFQLIDEKNINNIYVFQRGNAIFYLYNENDFEEELNQFNRIIIQV